MLSGIVLTIFVATFALIVFEKFDKALLALIGAILMICFGAINFEQALGFIEFETVVLLMSMMLLVEVVRESGIFSWVTVRLAKKSKGNPLVLFILFSLTTAGVSAFLDNVTTIVLIIPITVALIKGMGRDPRPYVMAEIFFSNFGGGLTLIGDPSNIIIGGASGLSFNEFVKNLALPVLGTIALVSLGFIVTHWKNHLKPISQDLKKLFLSHMLLKKIEYKWVSTQINTAFMVKSLVALGLTFMGFLFQEKLGISIAVIALSGAVLLLLVAAEEANIKVSLRSVEWSTLLFFCGLFVMVGAVESVGILDMLSSKIVEMSGGSYWLLVITTLWLTGFTSMILDNVPFVTLMVPIVVNIQAQLGPGVDPNLLWWALSMGAVFGGNGTMIGASANVVGSDIARKEGINISFLEFMKYGIPVSLTALSVATLYLSWRIL